MQPLVPMRVSRYDGNGMTGMTGVVWVLQLSLMTTVTPQRPGRAQTVREAVSGHGELCAILYDARGGEDRL